MTTNGFHLAHPASRVASIWWNVWMGHKTCCVCGKPIERRGFFGVWRHK